MTRRRIIEPGTTWALSRRTTRRYFLLNPDQARELEQAYWYCLGLAARRFGVVVHAGCLMSTHSHEVVTDVRGVLPQFLQEFHRLLALCTKALRGWPGEVFDKRSTGQHALLTPEATIESLAYLIANPVEAGAVRYAKDWPGAHTLPRDIGSRIVKVTRPAHYFDPDNAAWPDVVELRLEMPTDLELDYGTALAQARIAARVKAHRNRVCGRAARAAPSAHQAGSELRGLWEPQPAVCGRRAQRRGRRRRAAAACLQHAIRPSAGGVDRRQAHRTLSGRHLVDARVPWGAVWAGPVAHDSPREIEIGARTCALRVKVRVRVAACAAIGA
jgi:putative transposase